MLHAELRVELMKWQQSNLLSVYLICLLCLVFTSNTEAAGNLKYYDQAQAIIREMDKIMVKRGICSNTNDCRTKQVRFAGWYSWGISIDTYGIQSGQILNELLNVCSYFFFENNAQIELEFNIYPVSKATELASPLWNKPKPIKILMKGVNK